MKIENTYEGEPGEYQVIQLVEHFDVYPELAKERV